jgi:hypothetical protein
LILVFAHQRLLIVRPIKIVRARTHFQEAGQFVKELNPVLLQAHLLLFLESERRSDADVIDVVVVLTGSMQFVLHFGHFFGDEGRGKVGEE